MRYLFLFLVPVLLTACGHTYYVVRHAEKASPSSGVTMSTPNDPPLSEAGTERAQALLEKLKGKKIRHIYSTNTIRTRSTAEPLSKYTGVSVQTYGPRPDSTFINTLKSLRGNVLIVGHSNTVDDIVNGLCSGPTVSGDLPDSEYSNLFVIRLNRNKVNYKRLTYGRP